MRVALLALACGLLLADRGAAQDIRTALSSDTVRVGDIVGVGLHIILPRESEVSVADTLPLHGDLENAARKIVRIDTLSNGRLRHRFTYPITAWRPGTWPLPALSLTVRNAEGERQLSVPLPTLQVNTVLPLDTASIDAKPPRDVWGASRVWWPFILAGLLLLAMLAALTWWWRRRRRPVEAAAPVPLPRVVPPREWVLAELARIRAARHAERGEHRRFYIELSDVLRRYTALVDNAWSTDLTTRELNARMRQMHTDPLHMIAILERADLVKFARHEPGRERCTSDLDAAQNWAETFEKPLVLAEAA